MFKEANCRPLPATLHLTYLSNPSTPRYFSPAGRVNSPVQKVMHMDYTTDSLAFSKKATLDATA